MTRAMTVEVREVLSPVLCSRIPIPSRSRHDPVTIPRNDAIHPAGVERTVARLAPRRAPQEADRNQLAPSGSKTSSKKDARAVLKSLRRSEEARRWEYYNLPNGGVTAEGFGAATRCGRA